MSCSHVSCSHVLCSHVSCSHVSCSYVSCSHVSCSRVVVYRGWSTQILVSISYIDLRYFVIFIIYLTTAAPRYNAVVGVHEMEPRYKRGAL